MASAMRALVRYAWPHMMAVIAPAEVAALIAVVRNAHRHQQRAEVREAESERPELVRVLARSSRSDSWRCRR